MAEENTVAVETTTTTTPSTELQPRQGNELATRTETNNAIRIPLIRSPWLWMVLCCILLSASAVARNFQEGQFADAAEAAQAPPFPMRDLPRTIGHWEMVGEEQYMDEKTLTIAGCSDYMARRYVDNRTGVSLTVLVAFGPANRVFGHAPTRCFPAFGYDLVNGPRREQIRFKTDAGAEQASFDALVYSKPDGGADDLKEVYYSFRHVKTWDPLASTTRKLFRREPEMFKVQIERPLGPREINAEDSPSENFISDLIPIIENRLTTNSTTS